MEARGGARRDEDWRRACRHVEDPRTRRKAAAVTLAPSVARPSPKRVTFHSAKVITPDRRIHLAWKAMYPAMMSRPQKT